MFSLELTKRVRKNRPTIRLWLEVLEDRTLPSVSTMPMSVASPPAAVQDTAATSFAVSIMDQWSYLIATIQQDVIATYQALGQQIAQEPSALQLQWDRFLGISPSTANPSSGTAVPQAVTPSATTTGRPSAQAQQSVRQSSVQSPKGTYAVQTANYLWDPPNPANDDNASTAGNWWYEGKRAAAKPGTNAGDAVVFDPGDSLIKDGHGNADIIWDYNPTNKLTQMNMGPVGAYTGLQTIESGINVELTGVDALGDPAPSLQMLNTNGSLNLYFTDGTSKFQLDGDATITNMALSGVPTGQFIINGGTTTMAQSPGYSETIGVLFIINPGGTLNDYSYNPLKFTNSNIQIAVEGTMNVVYGTGTGATLIDYGNMSNDYINVNGGKLLYLGSGGVKDYFTVPVYVQGGGTFRVSLMAEAQYGGQLVVQDLSNYTFPNGKKESVYMQDADSSVQLAFEDTLECDDDYYQADGSLETTDSTTCTLQDGANSGGTAIVAGGQVWIDTLPGGTYGEFDVNAATLQFGGTLNVSIAGNTGNPGTSDVLRVNNGKGIFNLNPQANTALSVLVYGDPVGGNTWIVIYSSNITSSTDTVDFATKSTNPQTNLNYSPNLPVQGQYLISF